MCKEADQVLMAAFIMADWGIHRVLKEVMNPVESFAPAQNIAKTECLYLFQMYNIMEKPLYSDRKVMARCPLFLFVGVMLNCTCLVGGCRRLDKPNKYEQHAKETQIYNLIYEKTKQTK